jgi:hypothetical protein
MTLLLANSLNTYLKMNSNQTQTSDKYVLYMPSGLYALKPNPPTAEAVAKAQPFRADTVKKMEAIIKDPSYQIAE